MDIAPGRWRGQGRSGMREVRRGYFWRAFSKRLLTSSQFTTFHQAAR